MKILITGASGFIGSYLVEAALEAGMEVWAAVRRSSSRAYLQDPRIRFFDLDLSSDEALTAALTAHLSTNGPWDYVVHAAGATKCRTTSDFRRINTEGTVRLARLLLATGALTGRFVFISSLSIVGAVADTPAEPSAAVPTGLYGYPLIMDTDTPQPNTSYGRSKWEAEQALAAIPGLDYVVLRPTGVYGPRERDYFLMAKSICQHVDFAVGYRPQALTFIYVADLVQAAMQALTRGESGRAYFLTDGGAYSSRAFSDLLQAELGVRHVLHIKAPLWVLRVVSHVAGKMAALLGKTSTLNPDKYQIMKQRNWQCDISAARRELGYEPHYPLERGVREAVSWYRAAGWL